MTFPANPTTLDTTLIGPMAYVYVGGAWRRDPHNDDLDWAPPSEWPDATNTGATGALTPSSTTTLSTPGALVANRSYTTTVQIAANNITLRNCSVTGGFFFGIRIMDGVTGTTIEDCTIVGTTHDSNSKAIADWGAGGTTIRRCNISGHTDGISAGGDSVYRDNYLHDWFDDSFDPHPDGIEVYGGSNILIEHNTIDVTGGTSCINIANDFAEIFDVVVNNNRLLGSAAYTLYCRGNQPNNAGPVHDIDITNNRFITGAFGYASIQAATNVVTTGNVDDITGAPISL